MIVTQGLLYQRYRSKIPVGQTGKRQKDKYHGKRNRVINLDRSGEDTSQGYQGATSVFGDLRLFSEGTVDGVFGVRGVEIRDRNFV